jgi:hypothetical protein
LPQIPLEKQIGYPSKDFFLAGSLVVLLVAEREGKKKRDLH